MLLLKLRPYKTILNYTSLAARNPATRVRFYSWFLQSVVEGAVDP
jgi:hypothetical protein